MGWQVATDQLAGSITWCMLPARLARFDTDIEAVGQVAGLDQEAAGADSCGLGFV